MLGIDVNLFLMREPLILAQLATLYKAVAFLPDGTVTPAEAYRMERRLVRWGSSREVVEALERANAQLGPASFRVLVRSLRKLLPPEERDRVFEDLVAIANADGRFLDRGEALLNEIAELWGLVEA